MAEGNPLYAGIPNPTLVRREILLGTKDILGVLKSYERVSVIREQKLALIQDLKQTTQEIIVLNRRFKTALPKAPIKATPAKSAGKESHHAVAVVETEPDQIDLLEAELAKIEAELKGLQ